MAAGDVAARSSAHPIAHSLSPVLHRAAYAELGLDWTYDPVEVDSAGLGEFLAGPRRRVARAVADDAAEARPSYPARHAATRGSGLRASPTRVVLDDGRRLGFNTDIPGAIAAIQERSRHQRARPWCSAAAPRRPRCCWPSPSSAARRPTLLVRDPARAEETVAVVSAHPHAPELDGDPARATRGARRPTWSSRPSRRRHRHRRCSPRAPTSRPSSTSSTTPGPRRSRGRPWTTAVTSSPGLDLLAHQAVRQVQLMTGRPVPWTCCARRAP